MLLNHASGLMILAMIRAVALGARYQVNLQAIRRTAPSGGPPPTVATAVEEPLRPLGPFEEARGSGPSEMREIYWVLNPVTHAPGLRVFLAVHGTCKVFGARCLFC